MPQTHRLLKVQIPVLTETFTGKPQKIFDHYYSKEMIYERKRDFICRHINVKRNRNRKSYKQNSRTYLLPVGEELVRVCKQFFLKPWIQLINLSDVHWLRKHLEHLNLSTSIESTSQQIKQKVCVLLMLNTIFSHFMQLTETITGKLRRRNF